jgi:hypothetical protein
MQAISNPRPQTRIAARARQRGISLLGLLFLGVIIVFGALISLKVLPTVAEFLTIRAAVNKAHSDGIDPKTIRSAFDRSAAIEDITSITGKDLQIQREPGGGYSVSFAYEKRIPLAGPASLVLDYRGEAVAGRGMK